MYKQSEIFKCPNCANKVLKFLVDVNHLIENDNWEKIGL